MIFACSFSPWYRAETQKTTGTTCILNFGPGRPHHVLKPSLYLINHEPKHRPSVNCRTKIYRNEELNTNNAIVMYVTILHKEDEGTYLRAIKIDNQK